MVDLEDHYFLASSLEPLYFLKLGPIFDILSAEGFTKFGSFIWLQLIFGPKPCFLGIAGSSKGHLGDSISRIFLLWGHEKRCQIFKRFFVVFLYFINIPWMASILHATFCIFPGLIYNKKELLILVWNKTFIRVTQLTIFPDFLPNLSVTN